MTQINLNCQLGYQNNPNNGSEIIDKEFLSELQSTHKFIYSNIQGDSLSEKLTQAKVIILTERHDDELMRLYNAKVINSLWATNSVILNESDSDAQIQYVNEEYKKNKKCWDTNQKKEFGHAYIEAQQLLHHLSLKIVTLYIQFGSQNLAEHELISEYNTIIFGLNSFFQNIQSANLQNLKCDKFTIAHICSLAELWLSVEKQLKQSLTDFVDNSICPRNENLVVEILHYKDAARIFVVAGGAHVRPLYNEPNHLKAVNIVIERLNLEQIPFMILAPRKIRKLIPSSNCNDAWICRPAKDLTKSKYQRPTLENTFKKLEHYVATHSLIEIYKTYVQKNLQIVNKTEFELSYLENLLNDSYCMIRKLFLEHNPI